MSSALAVAATTAVLKAVIERGLAQADLTGLVGDVKVSALPPDRIDDDSSQLNLFMYQVTPNQGWRNVDLASRDSGGERTANPPLAIDLHYLVTAYGAEDLQAEILLGHAMQFLHELPVLTREGIRRVFTAPPGHALTPMLERLATAGLDDQAELVKLTPVSMSSEEMSKLWAVFGEKYRPTAAFLAAVVLIQSRASTRSGLPVLDPRLDVVPLPNMAITSVEPAQFLPGGGALLSLVGAGLGGQGVVAQFGNGATRPPAAGSDGGRFLVDPPNDLRPGVNTVHVVRPVRPGSPLSFESNAVPFVLRPRVTTIAKSGVAVAAGQVSADLTVGVTPRVGRRQRVRLLLNEVGAPAGRPARSYSFDATSRQDDVDETAGEVRVPVSGVVAGSYVVRLRVDGADSPLGIGAAGFDSPSVVLP